MRLIYTIGKRGSSKRHYQPLVGNWTPLCNHGKSIKRSGKSKGHAWEYERGPMPAWGACKDCIAMMDRAQSIMNEIMVLG